MALFPIAFLLLVGCGWVAALVHRPIWGLLTYIFVYFNIPKQQWWSYEVPDLRWSYISAAVLLVSCILHSSHLSSIKVFEYATSKLLLLFFFLIVATSIFSPFPQVAQGAVYDFFRYVLVYFLVVKVVTSFQHYRMIMAVMLGSLFYMAHVARSSHMGGRLEEFGLTDAADSNMLAALIVLLVPSLVAFIFSEIKWKRFIPVIPLLYIMNMFVLCRSRGAFLALIFQFIFAGLIFRKKIGMIKMIAVLLMASSIVFYLMDDQYKGRLFSLKKGVEQGAIEQNSAGRIEIWKNSLPMIKDYPLGAGGRTYEYLSPYYLPESVIEQSLKVRASHNTYLQVLVEQGVFGLIIYMSFIVAPIFALFKLCNLSLVQVNTSSYVHAVGLMLGLIGFSIAIFFINRLYFEGIYIVYGLSVFTQHRLCSKE